MFDPSGSTGLIISYPAKAHYARIETMAGSSDTLTKNDNAGEVFFLDGGGKTVNLPAITQAGEIYTIVFASTTVGSTNTINPNGTEVILKDTTAYTLAGGGYTWTVTGAGDSLTFISSSGAIWVLIGK